MAQRGAAQRAVSAAGRAVIGPRARQDHFLRHRVGSRIRTDGA